MIPNPYNNKSLSQNQAVASPKLSSWRTTCQGRLMMFKFRVIRDQESVALKFGNFVMLEGVHPQLSGFQVFYCTMFSVFADISSPML